MVKTKKGGKSALGEKITMLARQRGYAKPSDFAHDHGITLGTFNDLLYGKTKVFPDSVLRVSEALGVEPWELLSPTSPAASSNNQSVPGKKRENVDDLVPAPKESLRDPGADAHNGEPRNPPKTDVSDAKELFHALSSDIVRQIITELKSETSRTIAEQQKEIADLKAQLAKANSILADPLVAAIETATPLQREMVESVLSYDENQLSESEHDLQSTQSRLTPASKKR